MVYVGTLDERIDPARRAGLAAAHPRGIGGAGRPRCRARPGGHARRARRTSTFTPPIGAGGADRALVAAADLGLVPHVRSEQTRGDEPAEALRVPRRRHPGRRHRSSRDRRRLSCPSAPRAGRRGVCRAAARAALELGRWDEDRAASSSTRTPGAVASTPPRSRPRSDSPNRSTLNLNWRVIVVRRAARSDRFSSSEGYRFYWKNRSMRGLRPDGTRAGLIGPRSAAGDRPLASVVLLLACFGHAEAAGRRHLPQPEPGRQREPVQHRDLGLGGSTNTARTRRLHDPDQRQPRRKRHAQDRPQRARSPRPRRPNIEIFRMGYYEGARRPPRQHRDQSRDQQRLHLRTDGRDDRQGRLRQLGADLHDPRQRLPRLRRLPRQGHRLDRRTDPGRLHRPRRQPRSPSRRSSSSCRSPPTRPTTSSAASPSTTATRAATPSPAPAARSRSPSTGPSTGPAATTTGSSGPTSTCSTGWSARATTSPTPTTSTCSAIPAELLEHDTIVISGHSEYWSLEQFNGFLAARERRRQHRLLQRQHRLLEGPLRGRQPHPGLLQDGRGQRLRRHRHGQRERLGPGRDQRHRRRRPRPRRQSRHRRRQPAELDHDLPRQRRARRATPTRPPGGRVGPDMPENQLFGVMYVGDNDARRLPGHGPARQRQRRIRRQPRLAQHRHLRELARPTSARRWSTGSGTRSRPRRSTSRTSRAASSGSTRPTSRPPTTTPGSRTRAGCATPQPPPGQPGTIGARHATPPPAAPMVFAGGTMQWAYGLSSEADERIQQATYNVFSDMGDQPDTPGRRHARPRRLEQGPRTAASRSRPNPTKTANRRSPSTPRPRTTPTARSPNTNGTSTATAPSRPTSATEPDSHPQLRRPRANYNVRLRVTDNGGATDLAVQTLDDHRQPAADGELHDDAERERDQGEPIAFNGSASSDPDGTIAKYEWDFDGNGSYETNSAARTRRSATPTRRRAPTRSACGSPTTAARPRPTTLPVTVNNGGISNYSDTVLATPGLAHYWRMGETLGTTFADSDGSSPATATAASTLGVPGGVAGRPRQRSPLRRRQRLRQRPRQPLRHQRGHGRVLAEWDEFANDDHIAMEFTGSYHDNPGGFLIDPNAPQLGGKFAVGIGRGRIPQHGLLRTAELRRLAPLRLRPRQLRSGRTADHPLRRRQSGPLHQARERHRGGQLRQLDPLHDVARQRARCSAKATSTRWRSTTARSAPPKSPNSSTATAPTVARSPPSRRPPRPNRASR